MALTQEEFSALQEKIGYSFKNAGLLSQALVHPSYANEHERGFDNQRMEFLGDAVLDLLTAEYVYNNVPGGDEGVLTVLRSQCVSGQALAALAETLGIGDLLCFSSGSDAVYQRSSRRTLAAAFEAIVGAAWLDGGILACRAIFTKLMVPSASRFSANTDNDIFLSNPKGKLQAICQKFHSALPEYILMKKEGPQDSPFFTVKAAALGREAEGRASRRKDAEAAAAAKLITVLENEGQPL